MANLDLAAAFGAADAAKEQDLRGYYPMASRTLADEVRRKKGELHEMAAMLEDCAQRLEFVSGGGEHTVSHKYLNAAASVLRPANTSDEATL